MANIQRNFIAGRMNKSLDERLVPNGEYIDALNVRLGSTEGSEVGSVENTKGNTILSTLSFDGIELSNSARCIGAFEDGANETIYWFVHDPAFIASPTAKLDLIVSYNTTNNATTYNVISANDGTNINTTLNFSPYNLITGVNLIENLLYFTDNYNPPRFINVNRSYNSPSAAPNYFDGFTSESLLVIKRPPSESPTIQTLNIIGQEDDFLEERFISFAYRYKYADGEYSATSQFSDVAFTPSAFNFSSNSYLNEGMTNSKNAALITFNSGSSLVTGIQILFKESTTNNIKIIESLDKSNLGYSDNTQYTFTFDNRKIFTLLPQSELLRLYDNVPRLAKAQTIMGNRLVYGNYVDGYDLKDKFDQPIKLEFVANFLNEEIGATSLLDSTGSGNYTIGPSPQTINNSVVYFDLSKPDGTTVDLVAGASINLEFRIAHSAWTGNTPTSTTSNTNITFTYILPQNFDNVYSLATSTDFVEKIGTASNIQPVATACDGSTLTDQVNCLLPGTLGTYSKTASGITAAAEPISIISTPGVSTIGLQLIAMQYVDGANNAYEFYEVNFASCTYLAVSDVTSLHSNRGYEVGVVYMDEFNRSSTALVSPNNTIRVPCENSNTKNTLQVTIPQQQLAPSWATRYKFVLKPDAETYDTIYSNVFFQSPNDNSVYFLLEGESANKVETGDRLIVKRDVSGALNNCAEATVLEKTVQEEDFLTIPIVGANPAANVKVPSGVYMKINPNSFNTVIDRDSIIANGRLHQIGDNGAPKNERSHLPYPVSIENPASAGNYLPIDIPAGTRITFNFRFVRQGRESLTRCEKREYFLPSYDNFITLFSSQDYDSFYDWFVGDNIKELLDTGVKNVGGTGNPDIENYFIDAEYTATTTPSTQADWQAIMSGNSYDNYYQFFRNTSTGERFFVLTGGQRCATGGHKAFPFISADIQIYKSEGTIVFETEPTEALPDLWYENHLSFPISLDGQHTGNVQTQTSSQPAIIDTGFYNCFAFGNGVESYKILDSIIGKTLNIGERVTSTSNVDFVRAHRFADLTYSGVYNDETNVNKLNEFNLGLANFKPLEDSYGPIQILDGRKTDILTLQEDKISYVLAGVNLLSDAVGGGVVTAVPEVLGKQIARLEDYGISENPESYASYGPNKYFTDAKRGAVINLIGGAYNNEQLQVISEAGMRSWFRDLFINTFQTQKMGGFDPYMNEYILHSNVQVPLFVDECIECNTSKNLTILPNQTITYCVNVGDLLGLLDIDYFLPPATSAGFTITAAYGSFSTSSGLVFQDGSITLNKNIVLENTVYITVSHNGTSNETLEVFVGCPQSTVMTIFNVAVTSNADATQSITNEYRWTDGTFTSPLHSNRVDFSTNTVNPIVSQFAQVTGNQGAGIIPGDGADVSIISRKDSTNNFVFDPSNNKLKYLRTNTYYGNTPNDITNLLAAASDATPIVNQPSLNQYVADFNLPTGGSLLYLIWDYRKSNSQELCYSTTSKTDACTGCSFSPTPVPTAPAPVTTIFRWLIEPGSGSATSPTTCPSASVALYSTSSSFNTTFVNSTLFYTDAALTTLFQGGDNYYGVRQPNQGYGQSQGIFRMTDLGTASNIDTAGVCNPVPTPVPVPVPAPVAPVPAPVAPVPAPVAPVPAPVAPVPAPVAPVPAPVVVPVGEWQSNMTVYGNGYSSSSNSCAQSINISTANRVYLGDSAGAISTAQDLRDSAAAGRTVYAWQDESATTPLIPASNLSPWIGLRATPHTASTIATGMTINVSQTGTLVATSGSNLFDSCMTQVEISSANYAPFGSICAWGPGQATTTYYHTGSTACPQAGTADNIFTDVDLLTPLYSGAYSNYYSPCGTSTYGNYINTTLNGGVTQAGACTTPQAWYLNNGQQQGESSTSTSCTYTVSSAISVYLIYNPGGGNIFIQNTEQLDFAYANSHAVYAYADVGLTTLFDGSDSGTGVPLYYGAAQTNSVTPGVNLYIGASGFVNMQGSSYYSLCVQEFAMNEVESWFSSSADACSNGPTATTQNYYHDGSTTCVTTSNVVWMDKAKKTKVIDYLQYSISNKWYYQGASCGTGSGVALRFNSSTGAPSQIINC